MVSQVEAAAETKEEQAQPEAEAQKEEGKDVALPYVTDRT